jgi:hypothetical protein
MSVFAGNTSSSAISDSYDIATDIKSFSLVNKTGGTINVTVSILYGSTNVSVYKGQLSANGSYRDDVPQRLLKERTVYVLTDGSLDYYFTIE